MKWVRQQTARAGWGGALEARRRLSAGPSRHYNYPLPTWSRSCAVEDAIRISARRPARSSSTGIAATVRRRRSHDSWTWPRRRRPSPRPSPWERTENVGERVSMLEASRLRSRGGRAMPVAVARRRGSRRQRLEKEPEDDNGLHEEVNAVAVRSKAASCPGARRPRVERAWPAREARMPAWTEAAELVAPFGHRSGRPGTRLAGCV